MSSSILVPDSVRSISAHWPRAPVSSRLLQALQVVVLASAVYWCIQTSGQPYEAALSQQATARQSALEKAWAEVDYIEEDASQPTNNATAAASTRPMPNPLMPSFWAMFALVLACTFCALVWFVQRWSVKTRVRLQYTPADRITKGTYVFVTPHAHQGQAAIVPVRESVVDGERQLWFEFQRERFEVHESDQAVTELQFPMHAPLRQYVESTGLDDAEATAAQQRFGLNSLFIPMPTFWQLYSEQILGPVPVFQLFCASLWFLDQYWNYAFFNMFMIVAFEAGTTFSRLKSLGTLRGMKSAAAKVLAYRKRKWTEISTEELLPGDIFSLRRDNEDVTIPCDCLLLRGSAVVNEAALTGESMPQMKESVIADGKAGKELLDVENVHKVQALYGGTVLQQHTAPKKGSAASRGQKQETQEANEEESKEETKEEEAEEEEAESDPQAPARVGAPDGGIVCYCLRTGFASSQGRLVRMVEFSSEKVMSDSNETLILMILLFFFALCASGYVLKTGLAEGKRSAYELVLRCILILTAVVPPDLPMQTAIAVNAAILTLWKAGIFCTEPFRITYAGKVDTCLFDKTGTLTTDQLIATGVVNANSKHSSRKDAEPVVPVAEASLEACMVVGGCHALVEVAEKLAGDPMELAAVKGVNWHYDPASQRAFPLPRESSEKKKGEEKNASIVPAKKADEKKSSKPKANPNGPWVEIVHRYHFLSSLQRMSVVATVKRPGQEAEWLALVKGSPEMISTLLSTVPPSYEATYQTLAENGARVIALAYRRLNSEEIKTAQTGIRTGQALPREQIEQELTFAGFLAFSCLVRKDTAQSVRELQQGSHRVIMVTGDSPLTSLHVAQEVNLIEHDPARTLLLTETDSVPPALQWVPARRLVHTTPSQAQSSTGKEQPQTLPFVASEIPHLVREGHDLIVTGSTLQLAGELDSKTWEVLDQIAIFARMRPADKETVLRALKAQGHHTLMCGDGANDVGALKQAHVGIALLSGFGSANTAKPGETVNQTETEEEKQAKADALKARQQAAMDERKRTQAELQELQKKKFQEEFDRLTAAGESWAQLKAMKTSMSWMMEEAKRRGAEQKAKYGDNAVAAHAAMMAADLDTGEVPVIKLGDASMAAPFTSKLPSIKSTVDVIRQGRCTMVSSIQMQQILALNCLVAAYSLSALYIDGVRSGENMMIASGLLLTVASFAFSFARPVQELSPVRPISSLFHPAIALSIVGQLAIHLFCMFYTIHLCKQVVPEETEAMRNFVPEPINVTEDAGTLAPFKPSLLSTVVWLVETAQQVSVMAVNYKGRPFMLSAPENRPMMWSLLICGLGIFACAWEVIPELNEKLGLVPLPSDEFRFAVLGTLALSVLGALLWDRLIVFIFARDLLVVGMKDAWKAMPPITGDLAAGGKILTYVLIVGVASMFNIPPLLTIGGLWWLRKQQNAAAQAQQGNRPAPVARQ